MNVVRTLLPYQKSRKALAFLVLMLLALAPHAQAAAPAAAPAAERGEGNALASADATGGYSGKVLYKISRLWAPPPDSQNRRVSVRLRIDGNGVLQQCDPMTPSDLPEMNKAACAAAKEARDFGTPPYGMPIDVFVTFWTGHPSKNSLGARNPVTAPESPPKPAAKAPVPVTPKVVEKPQEKKAETKKGEDKKPETKKAEEKKPEGKKVEAPKVEPKAAVKTETKPAQKLEGKKVEAKKPEVKAEPKAPAKVEVKAPAKVEGKTETKPEGKTPTKVEPKAEKKAEPPKVEPKTEAKAPAKPVQETRAPAPAAPAPPAAKPQAVAVKTAPTLPSGPEAMNTAMRRYTDDIIFMARPRITLPARVPSGRYQVTVAMKVDNRGQQGGVEISKSSGQEALDQAVLTALGKLGKLSAPPDKKAQTLNLNFSILKP